MYAICPVIALNIFFFFERERNGHLPFRYPQNNEEAEVTGISSRGPKPSLLISNPVIEVGGFCRERYQDAVPALSLRGRESPNFPPGPVD
jgi:hypothetical protein